MVGDDRFLVNPFFICVVNILMKKIHIGKFAGDLLLVDNKSSVILTDLG